MSDYDMSIHTNRDAKEWAKFFMGTWKNKLNEIDEETMLSWFANAMMAMHDSLYNNEFKNLEKQNQKLIEFVKDCSVSHVESRYKHRAKKIILEINRGSDE